MTDSAFSSVLHSKAASMITRAMIAKIVEKSVKNLNQSELVQYLVGVSLLLCAFVESLLLVI